MSQKSTLKIAEIHWKDELWSQFVSLIAQQRSISTNYGPLKNCFVALRSGVQSLERQPTFEKNPNKFLTRRKTHRFAILQILARFRVATWKLRPSISRNNRWTSAANTSKHTHPVFFIEISKKPATKKTRRKMNEHHHHHHSLEQFLLALETPQRAGDFFLAIRKAEFFWVAKVWPVPGITALSSGGVAGEVVRKCCVVVSFSKSKGSYLLTIVPMVLPLMAWSLVLGALECHRYWKSNSVTCSECCSILAVRFVRLRAWVVSCQKFGMLLEFTRELLIS